jgi:hypothetical protein
LFSDDSMTTDRRWIRARQILDFSASYDIAESLAKETVGTLRRRGFKPLVRDSWDVVDLQERVIANLLEGSIGFSLVRRCCSILCRSHCISAAGSRWLQPACSGSIRSSKHGFRSTRIRPSIGG